MNPGIIIAVIVVLVLIIVISVVIYFSMSSTIQTTPTKNVREYVFYQGSDSPGNDIIQKPEYVDNTEALKEQCDALTGCIGFTTGGWLKNKIYEPSYRVKWTEDPKRGLYMLKSYIPVKP